MRQCPVQVLQKAGPVTFGNAHSAVRGLVVPAGIERRSTGMRAQIVDQQLFLPSDAVRAPVLPEVAESLVPNQAGKQIIDDGRNGVVSAEAGVQAVLHVLLLVLMKSRQGSTASGSCCDRSVVYG